MIPHSTLLRGLRVKRRRSPDPQSPGHSNWKARFSRNQEARHEQTAQTCTTRMVLRWYPATPPVLGFLNARRFVFVHSSQPDAHIYLSWLLATSNTLHILYRISGCFVYDPALSRGKRFFLFPLGKRFFSFPSALSRGLHARRREIPDPPLRVIRTGKLGFLETRWPAMNKHAPRTTRMVLRWSQSHVFGFELF